MKKNKTKFMDLNKETALRLWNKSFGDATKVFDYAGREIAKGAYNDRNSQFGWNVDHILPQSKGGKTAEHNLIICHISTNDEKADSFPVFNANGNKFGIIKVQNHYEIKKLDQKEAEKIEALNNSDEDGEASQMMNLFSLLRNTNLMDSASGIRYFDYLTKIYNKERIVATIKIRLLDITNTAIVDFIGKIFEKENVSYRIPKGYKNSITYITINNYKLIDKADVSNLLDKCVLLNTYLKEYFVSKKYLSMYDIYFDLNNYQDSLQDDENPYESCFETIDNTLYINMGVYQNSEAKEKCKEGLETLVEYHYCEYDYIFTNLAENLKKEGK